MSKLNSEFNYRYQVQGETVWEKIKHLQEFLAGRVRAAALEEVAGLKYAAKQSELAHVKENNSLPHVILTLQAELIEMESFFPSQKKAFAQNKEEIEILEKLLKELFLIAEPSRIDGFTDEQMFEANAANEFTVMIGRDIQAEIIACGHPSPAKIRNAMSNPYTFAALRSAGLIPMDVKMLVGNIDPLKIELTIDSEN